MNNLLVFCKNVVYATDYCALTGNDRSKNGVFPGGRGQRYGTEDPGNAPGAGEKGLLLFDLRTVFPEQDEKLAQTITSVMKERK